MGPGIGDFRGVLRVENLSKPWKKHDKNVGEAIRGAAMDDTWRKKRAMLG